MSFIQEVGRNGPGSSCLDLRRVVWGCDAISTWLIRVQRSEGRSISYLHLFNNYFLSTCYISSSVPKTQTEGPYSFLLSGMASPRTLVGTRNYWNKYIKVENILYLIEDPGHGRITLGNGKCDLENEQKTEGIKTSGGSAPVTARNGQVRIRSRSL